MKGNAAIRGDVCSVGKRMGRNDDYAIYTPDIGACVADGVGGAPLGDALARLACCVAMRALKDGSSAVEAVNKAKERVVEFVKETDSPASGTSLTVIKFRDDSMEAAWLGDVALFVCMQGANGNQTVSTLEEFPPSHYLCCRKHEEPQHMEIPLKTLNDAVACTDGVWRRLGASAVAKMMESPLSVREKAARLAMGEELMDDSTALVLSVERT